MKDTRYILVVGAGPAGMMAAYRAAACGAQVTLYEKNSAPGKKLLLTGNGRCNLTNRASRDDFFAAFGRHGRFLQPAFETFFAPDLVRFFNARGVTCSAQDDGRIFPSDNRASSVVRALETAVVEAGVERQYKTAVDDLFVEGKTARGIMVNRKKILADAVIIATGGITYPATGSTGEWFARLAAVGHTIVPLRPGLISLEVAERDIKQLAGVCLQDAQVTLFADMKRSASRRGDVVFTHSGVSGPTVLSLSAMAVDLLAAGKRVRMSIDVQPQMTAAVLDRFLQRQCGAHPKKTILNVLRSLVPERLAGFILAQGGISPVLSAGQLTGEGRKKIGAVLKDLSFTGIAPRAPQTGMVTQGGVALKEINPRTAESRIVKGLYVVGEALDLAGNSGGFNLQAAFSTGYLAGQSAATRSA